MKNFMKTMLISSVVSMVSLSPVLADDSDMPYQQNMMSGSGPGYGMGYGRGHGQGMGPGYGYGMGPGYGMGYGHGMGPGYGQGMGPGYGMGYGHGMGPGYGQGMSPGYGMGYGHGMAPGYGMGYGRGMTPGYGMGNGRGMGPGYAMGMLDLSDDQIKKLEQIQTETMKSQRALMRQIWQEQQKMEDFSNADRRDPAVIGKAYGKISELQQKAIEGRINMENKMENLLNEEQKKQMKRRFNRGMMDY